MRVDFVSGGMNASLGKPGVTGENHHVDCGYNVVGMLAVDAAQGVRDMLENFSPKRTDDR